MPPAPAPASDAQLLAWLQRLYAAAGVPDVAREPERLRRAWESGAPLQEVEDTGLRAALLDFARSTPQPLGPGDVLSGLPAHSGPMRLQHLARLVSWLLPVASFDALWPLLEPLPEAAQRELLALLPGDALRTRACLAPLERAVEQPGQEAVALALLQLAGRCAQQGLAPALQAVLNALHARFFERHPEAYATGNSLLLAGISEPALLARIAACLPPDGLWTLVHRYEEVGWRDWSPLYALARQAPRPFTQVVRADPGLAELLWREAKTLGPLVGGLAAWFAPMRALLQRLHAESPEQVDEALGHARLGLSQLSLEQLAELLEGGPASLSRVAALTLLSRLEAAQASLTAGEEADAAPVSREEARARLEHLRPLALQALTRFPELLAQATSTYSRNSSPLAALPPEALPSLVPALRALLVGTQALEPVRTVQTFLSRAAPQQVLASGLATDAEPRVRRAVLQALCHSRAPGLADVLRQLCARAELGAVDRGLLLDTLEALGEDVAGLDREGTLSLEAWEALARAEGAEAWPKDLRGLPLLTALAPLGELPARWLLTQAKALGEARLPRPFRHLLERHLPPGALPALGLHALHSWLEVKGKTSAAWMLALIAEYGGDEAVTTICRQIDAWRRNQKPKANTAIRALAKLGTPFALSQLERIASAGGRYTDSLVQNAREGLEEAAAARGLTVEQLREELVPDLGLTPEGLVVDLGPRKVRVRPRADLSLEVHHESGRVTQSFPALKKDEDPEKHAAGRQQFDVLRKNLLPVLKQQYTRLEEVLLVQGDYAQERWQRLFLRHPVLRLGVQPVLWTRLTPGGEVVGSFRIAEDGTLVDAQNSEVRLHPSERVGLWHPVLEDAQTHALWGEHLSDYQLLQPFRQLERQPLRPSAEERGAVSITRFAGVQLWASRLRNSLERLGCKAPVGEGGMLHEHARSLPNHGVGFRVLHSPLSMRFELEERAELGRLEYTLEPSYRQRHGLPMDRQPTLGELPPVLCACLLEVMSDLAAQA